MRDVIWKDGETRQELSKKEQRILREMMNGGTVTQICERAKASKQTYYRMLRNPRVSSVLPKAIDFLLSQQLLPMIQIVMQKAMGGSAKHAELMLKVSGLISGENETKILQIFSKDDGQKFLTEAQIDKLLGRHDERHKRIEEKIVDGDSSTRQSEDG